MTGEQNRSSVILLPYRLASEEELRECDDIEVLSAQLRLYGAEQIRLVQAGKLNAHNIAENIKRINQHLQDFGKPVFCLDFLDELPAAMHT